MLEKTKITLLNMLLLKMFYIIWSVVLLFISISQKKGILI